VQGTDNRLNTFLTEQNKQLLDQVRFSITNIATIVVVGYLK
jgi:hypothetical protein